MELFKLKTRVGLIVSIAAVTGGGALAQGTGSVASPVVNPGTSISFAAGTTFEDGNIGQRLDYRQSVSDKLRVSALVFFNYNGGEYRFRRLSVEAMHQFASSENGWNSAVQVRGRFPNNDDDSPGRVRVAWLNRWRNKGGAELRLIGLAAQEFGVDRRDGLALETRAEATWRVSSQTRLGAQLFNRYNRVGEFGSFKTQRHSLGGVVKGSLTERVSYRMNVLKGLSDAAADFELRVRFSFDI